MVKPESVQAPSFAALVQAFFAEHLQQQRAMSPRTVAAYRDAFVLFLDFAQARLHKQPTAIRLEEITPALILAFLDHLERERGKHFDPEIIDGLLTIAPRFAEIALRFADSIGEGDEEEC